MHTADFDFELPEELIALRPAKPRDSARLLVVRPEAEPELAGAVFRELPDFLRPGDVLVFNDTKVIPAALTGRRQRGDGSAPKVRFNLHKRLDDARWLAFARPAKKLAAGDKVLFGCSAGACSADELWATVEEKRDDGEVLLAFSYSGPVLDETLARVGDMPLPPYIANRRRPDIVDRTDYQTIYAAHDGSVAAPTAGLHFTEDLFARLDEMGIARHFVTLHVGAGTFLPVKTDRVEEHVMHAEYGTLDADTAAALNAAREEGRRVIAVGTTSLRILESAADDDGVHPFAGETDIFITPGHRFRAVDGLITNFHLPRSTLFMLVAAFSGLERMKRAYAHAIADRYRFYSYGDACLLFPTPEAVA